MNTIPGMGADESEFDSRTIKHDVSATLAFPLVSGGCDYLPQDMQNQHTVGICTAISLTQNAGKALGGKFSPDFQYLLQKKVYDMNWYEGSSIFVSLKVGKNYGFLPIEFFADQTGKPYIVEADRTLSYTDYIAKLQVIPDSEIQRLIGLCTNKLTGYASLPIDAQSIAKGIIDSKSGILCRYSVGEEWWHARDGRVSWASIDIDPLRPPVQPISGHAIGASKFDFSVVQNITHPNTWGTLWNDQNRGNCHTIHTQYSCTEAWIPYYGVIPTPAPQTYIFTTDLHFGDTSDAVRQLQKKLVSLGYSIPSAPTNFFGGETRKAVIQFQTDHNIALTYFQRNLAWSCVVGPKTRELLNKS